MCVCAYVCVRGDLVADLLDGLQAQVVHGEPSGVFADPPPLGDLVDLQRLPPLAAAGQAAALHDGLHLHTGEGVRPGGGGRSLQVPLGVCTLLAGSFSLREEMSFQLSSQERLSESSPLSLSAYCKHTVVRQRRRAVTWGPAARGRPHQALLLQQQVGLLLLPPVLELHVLQPEDTTS